MPVGTLMFPILLSFGCPSILVPFLVAHEIFMRRRISVPLSFTSRCEEPRIYLVHIMEARPQNTRPQRTHFFFMIWRSVACLQMTSDRVVSQSWSGSLCFRLQCLEAQLVDFLRLVSATILFILAKIQSIKKKLPIFPSFLHNGGTSKANLVSCTK